MTQLLAAPVLEPLLELPELVLGVLLLVDAVDSVFLVSVLVLLDELSPDDSELPLFDPLLL
jgi:hypothetical protein